MTSTTPLNWNDTDEQAVRTLKALAADAVEKVGNGHPGTAISLAPAAYLLFNRVMHHDPSDPDWAGRDRFVLSIGHSSLTLYMQLFLAGYPLSLEDLKSFRTFGSATPGHPEYRHTAGVEMTTGPLGQGLSSAVGMAIAAKRERELFDPNAGEDSPFDHTIFVMAGDGDLQEGITAEASSLAGTLELGNLVVIYDDNAISIEGHTSVSFTEDVLKRYEAYGWHTQHVDWRANGAYHEDVDALYQAVNAAKAETSRPSIIKLSTIIGWPSPTKQDTGAIHGEKLGTDEVAGLKRALGLDPEKTFDVPQDVIDRGLEAKQRGAADHAAWNERLDSWRSENPEPAALFDRLVARKLPSGWESALPTFEEGGSVSTRKASGEVLSALGKVLPELWGGSADLAGSNNTTMAGADSFRGHVIDGGEWPGQPGGRTLHFGIREHAMGAILNGIALHGPTRPYGGTFLVFSDYMRGAVRLASVMGVPSTFVWTHDSIGVGEDGPTHQPVEHLTALRAIPGLDVVRPADANETAQAWKAIMEHTDRPAGIILTRQNLPTFERSGRKLGSAQGVGRGAYVLADTEGTPDVILMGSGSEVQLAMAAREKLAADGIAARVVSVPCFEWFQEQSDAYRQEVLPESVRARVSVEAGLALPWRGLVGDAGRSVSLEHYGASGAGPLLFEEFGITSDAVVAAARESLAAAAR